LTNPAGAEAQVVGVADKGFVEKITMALEELGCRHALVVHGESGLDEIAINGRTLVYELKDGEIKNYYIGPEDFSLPEAALDSIKGGTAAENAAIVRSIFEGNRGPQRDIVLMNAAAVLLVGDRVENLSQGLKVAEEVIDSGRAMQKLEKLVAFSRE
jgi:anthranilate phosphoribosyltransferase